MMGKKAKSMEQRARGKEHRGKALIKKPMRKDPHLSILRSEKGLALVTVLILSLITLAIISTLIYMVIQGTRVSGFYKRYETAREAAIGGAEIGGDLVLNRGAMSIAGLTLLSSSTGAGGFIGCDCGDPDDPDDNQDTLGVRTCLCDKLCDSTANWPGACSITLNPMDSPDLEFNLAGININTNYLVSVKIVDTIQGNSDVSLSGGQLGGTAVVSSSSSVIPAPPMPYLLRVEINSEDTINQLERARLSALYAY